MSTAPSQTDPPSEPLSSTLVDARLIHGRRFTDTRGSFQETYNISRSAFAGYECRQVSFSTSAKGVLRGMHCSKYDKIVTCTKGKLYDVCLDLRPWSPSYLQWAGVWLSASNAKQVHVPAGHAHGFVAVEEDTEIMYVQRGTYNKDDDVEVNALDPALGITWPQVDGVDQWIMSEKDAANPTLQRLEEDGRLPVQADFLLIGVSGYLGSEMLQYVKESGRSYTVAPRGVRLEDLRALEALLDMRAPKYVVCAAGLSGRPNIDWCETHQEETIMVNIVGQLNVARACSKRGIHCTLFGTGSMYTYDETHALGSGVGFREDDEANFDGNFYVRCRIMLEQLLKSYADHVLNLRIIFPVSSSGHERSLVSKLVRYPKIVSVPTSFTVVDALFPLIPELSERRVTGNLNFSLAGVSTNKHILQMYQKHVDPEHTWEDIDASDQLKVTSAKRAYAELDTSRLYELFPDLPNVEQGIEQVFERLAAASSSATQ